MERFWGVEGIFENNYTGIVKTSGICSKRQLIVGLRKPAY